MPRYLSTIDEALSPLRRGCRIVVIGCSGGGKSTLSKKLSHTLNLPYISMDRDFFWLPGWVKRSKIDERALMAAKAAEDRWIMDGRDHRALISDCRERMSLFGFVSRVGCVYGDWRVALP